MDVSTSPRNLTEPNCYLSGKTAIVTGGGRGLGRAMTLGLARAVANVVITAAQSYREIDAVANEAAKNGQAGAVHAMMADAASEVDCLHVLSKAIREFGAVHILVNNAGAGCASSVSDSSILRQASGRSIRRLADDNRHQRQWALPNGPCGRAAHAQTALRPHRQHLDEPRDDAADRLFALRSFQGRARIGNHHLGARPRRNRRDRQLIATGRSDRHRDGA